MTSLFDALLDTGEWYTPDPTLEGDFRTVCTSRVGRYCEMTISISWLEGQNLVEVAAWCPVTVVDPERGSKREVEKLIKNKPVLGGNGQFSFSPEGFLQLHRALSLPSKIRKRDLTDLIDGLMLEMLGLYEGCFSRCLRLGWGHRREGNSASKTEEGLKDFELLHTPAQGEA